MKIPPFIRKLKLILQGIAPEIAGWNEEGNVFEVCDARAFTNELSKHFKGNEQTFIRQLNLYGFTKEECTRNLRKLKYPLPPALPGSWSFSHPLALRDSLDLMDGLVRNIEKKATSGQQQQSNSVDSLEEINDDNDDDNNSNSNSYNNNNTVRINSREWNQMKRKNRGLEAVVEALQAKLSTLTMFLEEEGYDIEAIRASSQSSLLSPLRKKQKQSESADETETSSKNKKREREWYDLSQPFEKQLLMDLLFQPSSSSPLSFDDDNNINVGVTPSELQPITEQQQQDVSSNTTTTDVGAADKANQQSESNKSKDISHFGLNENFLDRLNQPQALDLEFARELQSNQQQQQLSNRDECASRKCKCKTESMLIDSQTLSKVVKHFREVLRIVMNADISCGSSCSKVETDGPFNSSKAGCYSSNDNEKSKINSCCATETTIDSNEKNEAGCCSSSSNVDSCCTELKRRFKSNPIQHLLSLQQIKAEL